MKKIAILLFLMSTFSASASVVISTTAENIVKMNVQVIGDNKREQCNIEVNNLILKLETNGKIVMTKSSQCSVRYGANETYSGFVEYLKY